MSEVVQDTQHEFWRPVPLVAVEAVEAPTAVATMADACASCGTEFLLGSRFCHTCGRRRPEAVSSSALADAADMAGLWENAVERTKSAARFAWGLIRVPSWLHYLHFHEIKRWVGLPTASLIAFITGLGCVAGALLVGLLTVKTLVDWQAIQLYRAEWLLAATAAFVAGILLRKPSGN